MGISIGLAVFAGLSTVTDRPTDRLTDRLSLLPSVGRKMNTGQRAVTLCGWGVKAWNIPLLDKRVCSRQNCVIPRAIPEHFSDEFLMIKRCRIKISLYVYFTYFTYGHSSNIKDINMIFYECPARDANGPYHAPHVDRCQINRAHLCAVTPTITIKRI